MRPAITNLILLLGRYATLPVIAVAAAVFVAWFIALDDYPLPALIALPVVLPIATTAMAVGLGLLLPFRHRPDEMTLSENSAPGLWAIWNEFDRTSPRASRTLSIDPEHNASIAEEKQYLGLFRRHLTMTVGLTMLIALDERAVRAVVAHEVAHARLRHTSGAQNLQEFIRASTNLFAYADPDRTITGWFARAVLASLLDWVSAEYRIMSRRDELAADLGAAERVGRYEMARALVLSHVAGVRINDLIYKPLKKELLGAIRAPTPPLQRIVRQLDAIRAPDGIAVAALPAQEDADATHPHVRTRLANLGFADIPDIDGAATSAADALLSADTLNELLTGFDREWCRRADRMVGIS